VAVDRFYTTRHSDYQQAPHSQSKPALVVSGLLETEWEIAAVIQPLDLSGPSAAVEVDPRVPSTVQCGMEQAEDLLADLTEMVEHRDR
jgi:hypothetical protein